MHRSFLITLFVAVSLIATASTAVGQEATTLPPNTSVVEVSPRPGHALEFEAALKEHMAWSKAQNSTWRWVVFEVVYGKRVGNYLMVSRDHSWEEFDENHEFATTAMARWRASVDQHVRSVEGAIYRLLPDLSRVPENLDSYPLVGVSFFSMRPTSARPFLGNLRKMTNALKTQESAPPALWYQQDGGGEQGTFMTMRPFKKWTEWPNIGLARAQSKAMDPKETNAIIQELGKVILSEETSVVTLRPDLGSQ